MKLLTKYTRGASFSKYSRGNYDLGEFTSYPYMNLPDGDTRITQGQLADDYLAYRAARNQRTKNDPEVRAFLNQYGGGGTDQPLDAERAYLVDRGRKETYTYTPERQQALDSSINALRDNRDIKKALGTMRMSSAYDSMSEADRAKLTPRELAKMQSINADEVQAARQLLEQNPDRLRDVQSAYKKAATLAETSRDRKVYLPNRTTERPSSGNDPKQNVRSEMPSTEKLPSMGSVMASDFLGKDLENTSNLVEKGIYNDRDTERFGTKSPRMRGATRQFRDNEFVRAGISGSGARTSRLGVPQPAPTEPEVLDINMDPGDMASTRPMKTIDAEVTNVPTGGSEQATPKAKQPKTETTKVVVNNGSKRSPEDDLKLYQAKKQADVDAALKVQKARDKNRMSRGLMTGGLLVGGGAAIAGGSILYDQYKRKQEEEDLNRFRQEAGLE